MSSGNVNLLVPDDENQLIIFPIFENISLNLSEGSTDRLGGGK